MKARSSLLSEMQTGKLNGNKGSADNRHQRVIGPAF